MAGRWTQIEVAGKKVDLFEPGARPRFAVLFLHAVGLESLADNPVYTAVLEKYNLACVVPHGGRCWWLDRICPEFDSAISPEQFLTQKLVPFCRQRWQLGAHSLGVFGISMGGQGSLRLAFRHPDLFPVTAGIASALDFYEIYGEGGSLDEMYDSKEQCRQDTALMHIPPHHYPPHIYFCIDPEDVEWYRGNDRLHEKLSALGIPHTIDMTTEAGGHSWDYFNHMAEPVLKFMVEGLEKESRRLL